MRKSGENRKVKYNPRVETNAPSGVAMHTKEAGAEAHWPDQGLVPTLVSAHS